MLETFSKYVDIIQKVVVGIAIGSATFYYTRNEKNFDLQRNCVGMEKDLWSTSNIGSRKNIQISDVQALFELLPPQCNVDANKFFRAYMINKSVDNESRPENTTVPAPESMLPPPTIGAASIGWVAVGMKPFANYGDSNFGLLPNDTQPPSDLAAGTILKSRWQVNVRPGPADWTKVNTVLTTGYCATVKQSRTLSAGAQTQLWAEIAPAKC